MKRSKEQLINEIFKDHLDDSFHDVNKCQICQGIFENLDLTIYMCNECGLKEMTSDFDHLLPCTGCEETYKCISCKSSTFTDETWYCTSCKLKINVNMTKACRK